MLPDGWKFSDLGSCCSKPKYGANAPAIGFTNSEPRYVRITDIGEDGQLIEANKKSIRNQDAKDSYLSYGDVIFARSGATVGKAYLHDNHAKNIAYAGYLIKFSPKQNILNPHYLFQYTQSYKYKLWVRNNIRAGAQPNINAQEYSSMEFPLPPLREQKTILETLTLWDDHIYALDHLIIKKQKQKKALMQRLLTGKNRFPEFVQSNEIQKTRYGNLPADWQYVHIKNVASHISTKNIEGKDLPVLSCTKHHGLVNSADYFKKQVHSKDLSTYKIIKKGQFAYATNHIEEGSIGYQTLYDEAVISPMYTIFKTNNKIDDGYLFKLVKTDLYKHIFGANTNASVDRRGSLRWPDFSKLYIPLPSIPEQQKITTVLNTADEEINLLTQKLEAYQAQKKGLMQQLLTGKKRVKLSQKEAA